MTTDTNLGTTERSAPRATVDVLLGPTTALVVDIFRALGDFEASYDVAVIDMLEQRLTGATDGQTARAVVSDALLLGFALRNQRTDTSWPHRDWDMHAIGARRATAHECATLALIAAARAGDTALAADAARRLGVRLNATIASLSRDMGTRLEAAGLEVSDTDWAPLMASRDAVTEAEGDPARRMSMPH
ncbi:hypothetical protein [Salinarimonas ramus]|uniref:Uncharacterized protein n=1 Tax=Salinarimonas ramus TaxID=690164 RepID=A0A917Q9K3_9HYPH|nr:hypothetical protein [Salinarimonas ramus]GGK37221.1 hypothetical protein GCM10011322_25330 [Salinarimonas ramus]